MSLKQIEKLLVRTLWIVCLAVILRWAYVQRARVPPQTSTSSLVSSRAPQETARSQ